MGQSCEQPGSHGTAKNESGYGELQGGAGLACEKTGNRHHGYTDYHDGAVTEPAGSISCWDIKHHIAQSAQGKDQRGDTDISAQIKGEKWNHKKYAALTDGHQETWQVYRKQK